MSHHKNEPMSPYNLTYEEFVKFMERLKQKAFNNKKKIDNHKKFSSKEEYMKYYGAISIEDYIRKSHSKY